MTYHVPVMLDECIEGLNIDSKGVYVDLTFGGGGHSEAILSRLDGGVLIGFDQDIEAQQQALLLNKRGQTFHFVLSNFRHLRRQLTFLGFSSVDGILVDLGISSHQIDTAERGFSTRFSSELDMRMNQTAVKTAATVLNEPSEGELQHVLGAYGEIRNAKTLAKAIIAVRSQEAILTTGTLVETIRPFAPKNRLHKYAAQVFQALRIAVNDELGALEEMLLQTEKVLNPGGRFVAMSYHSLEDRCVKRYINTGQMTGEVKKDFYGNLMRPFDPVTRKPLVALREELDHNPRARSAKLRVAQKR